MCKWISKSPLDVVYYLLSHKSFQVSCPLSHSRYDGCLSRCRYCGGMQTVKLCATCEGAGMYLGYLCPQCGGIGLTPSEYIPVGEHEKA